MRKSSCRILRWVALIGLLTISLATPADTVLLVENGQPRATIVLAENPRASAQLAAFELQHYLEKMSGARLPITRELAKVEGNRILVGESSATKILGYTNGGFDRQEYLIKTLPSTLILIGHDHDEFSDVDYASYSSIYHALPSSLATCYAAHAFLEGNLGVRWYYPNEEIGEVVPLRPTIAVEDLNIRRKPDAAIRMLYPLFSNTEKLYFTDYDQPEKLQSSWVDARQSLLYWIRLRYWGATRYNANHSFHGYDQAFGKSHPEWFSTKSHDKMKSLRYQGSVQPCLTAPGFLDEVVRIAGDHFDGREPTHPDTNRAAVGNFFPVVPNDNTQMCRCPTCTPLYRHDLGPGGEASHYVWGFVNEVARKVRLKHPHAMVSGLAYFNYTLPPEGMVFEPNVSVTFCKFYQKYHDRDYQQRDYERIAEYVDKNKARFFTTWEYPIHPFMDYMPFPCLLPRVQADDVRRLREIAGFRGGIMDRTGGTTYRSGKPVGLAWTSPVMDFMNVYWRVKLYDNFEFDIERGLTEYYEGFFGPGSDGMEKFYTAIENRWMKFGGGNTPQAWWNKLGTTRFLDDLAGYIQQAHNATSDGSIYRQRVELIDAGIMQYLLKARAKYEMIVLPELAPIGTGAVAYTSLRNQSHWANDDTWADALPNEIRKTDRNGPAPQKTIFKLAHDRKRLYVYARCFEPQPDRIKAETRSNDTGGFNDDSIELLIDPVGKGKKYYQLCINTAGAVYDAVVDPVARASDVEWDSDIQVKTAVSSDYWELRAALPFAGLLDNAPRDGSTLRFNICRNRFTQDGQPARSGWSSTLGGLRNPQRFGIVTFNTSEDRGRLLWNCDFEGSAFMSPNDSSELVGFGGWYENTNYANRGWARSWEVVERDENRLATGDLNRANLSDLVPMHAAQVLPGTFSVEAEFRRLSVEGSMPGIRVSDYQGRAFAVMYAWPNRGDLIAIEQSKADGGRQNYSLDQHGIPNLAGAGKRFGLKLVIDTTKQNVTGYVRSGEGLWLQLNQRPLRYNNRAAQGTELLLGFGSRKLKRADQNILEMDNIRVRQPSVSESPTP